ncbi:hypothetical protein N2W52_002020 [Clostridium perfringens]|nr:hypothetical protein [Clostridium perfringens]MDK0983037.1 hypothetical protein [Clostridium perfringens]
MKDTFIKKEKIVTSIILLMISILGVTNKNEFIFVGAIILSLLNAITFSIEYAKWKIENE